MPESPMQSGTAQQSEIPLLPCDLVMKGGITSGIAYPPAILQLMEQRKFNRIGGTSAGAIAAAGVAAAEFHRQNGGGDASNASMLVFRRDAIPSSAPRTLGGSTSFDHALASLPWTIFVPFGGVCPSESKTVRFDR